MKCCWCEKYLKNYSEDTGALNEVQIKREEMRIKDGFWSSINNIHQEWELANQTFSDVDAVVKIRMPLHIDIKFGETHFGRFWMYSLAEKRDQVMEKEQEHFWILSGGHSMSWTTPICCELGNISSDDEALEWELTNFDSIINETKKVKRLVDLESSPSLHRI